MGPVRWNQSPVLYRVAIKAGFYKAIQECYIPVTATLSANTPLPHGVGGGGVPDVACAKGFNFKIVQNTQLAFYINL